MEISPVKGLLARHGFRFSKAKGQNFLIAAWVPQRIAEESGIDRGCGVLEVGLPPEKVAKLLSLVPPRP